MDVDVDVETVARQVLRWWAVRREIGLVAEGARLRGLAAEVRDRGVTNDPAVSAESTGA